MKRRNFLMMLFAPVLTPFVASAVNEKELPLEITYKNEHAPPFNKKSEVSDILVMRGGLTNEEAERICRAFRKENTGRKERIIVHQYSSPIMHYDMGAWTHLGNNTN